jgi:hypothetical protein
LLSEFCIFAAAKAFLICKCTKKNCTVANCFSEFCIFATANTFAIHSRNGRDISNISEFNGIFAPDNQKEVLLDKNTKFRITKQKTDKDGTVWIEMTEL